MIITLARSFKKSLLLKRLEGIIVPQPGEGIAEITIKNWLIQPNQKVKEFDKVCDAFSDKSSLDLTSLYDGTIKEILYKDGETVKVGDVLYKIDIDDSKYPLIGTKKSFISSDDSDNKDNTYDSMPIHHSKTDKSHKHIAPAVRHLAKKHKIDLSTIKATGKKGMVLKEDILRHLETPATVSDAAAKLNDPKSVLPPPMPEVKYTIKDKFVKLTPLQISMKTSMKESLSIPQLTFFEDIYMDQLIGLRQQLKNLVKDTKITYVPFFMKALSLSMLDYPIINSYLSDSKTEYIQKSSHNISVAMDSPKGLLLPNIKNVGALSIYEIAREMFRLQNLAATGNITENDLNGGTITISNIGSIGGNNVAHVLFPKQSVIGAFGSITKRLEKINGQLIEKSVIATSWSADHRIIDGATVARFVMRWKAIIENPSLMLLHLK